MPDTRAVRKDAGQPKQPTHDKVFREFEGINTQAKRQAIAKEQFAWIENVMPLGHGNAIILPTSSAALQTVASGTCVSMWDYNINGVNYMAMFTNDGHGYQVALDSPYTRTTIGSGFSNADVTAAPWRGERLLIGDPTHGLFDWDGSTLTGPDTVLAVNILAGGSYANPGTGYPTISFSGGGGGSGAAALPILGLNGAQAVFTGGASYQVGDILTVSLPLGANVLTQASVKVTTIGGSGAVTAVAVFEPGAYINALPSGAVNLTGGNGSGCTIVPNYAVFSAQVTAGGHGYSSAPTVTVSAGTGGNTALATSSLSSAPSNPFRIATFADRVWIVSGTNHRTLSSSAPTTYRDFSGPGSNTTIISTEALNGGITALLVANNFLYYFGVDSVNVIGDVQLDSNGNTIYSDTNLTTAVGTKNVQSILAYFRSVMFSNPAGVYSMPGSTPLKASDALDGIFGNVNPTAVFSAATFMLNNVLCAGFMVDYVVNGAHRSLILIHFNRKWFLGSQGDHLTIIQGGIDATGQQRLYATDGTSLFRLFDTTTPAPWKIQTAFWDMDAVTKTKQIVSFGFEVDAPQNPGTIHVCLDTLTSQPNPLTNSYTDSQCYDVLINSAQQVVEWINNAGSTVQWQNNSNAIVQWATGPGSSYTLDMQDGSAYGKYVGITMTSSDVFGTISSEMLRFIYREEW